MRSRCIPSWEAQVGVTAETFFLEEMESTQEGSKECMTSTDEAGEVEGWFVGE